MSLLDDDDADLEITEEPYVKVGEEMKPTSKVDASSVRQKLENVSLSTSASPAEISHSTEPGMVIQRDGVSSQNTDSSDQIIAESADSSDEKKAGGWGLGGFSSIGSSILSTASNSVTTLSHSIGEGFDRFVESVEYSLGAEDPEEFARREYDHQQQLEAAIAEESKKKGNKISSAGDAVTKQVRGGEADRPPGGVGNEATGEDAEASGGGWLSGWGMPSLATVVKGTTDVVKKTVKETSNVVQQTTDVVQKTGKGIVTGGLDVLENIGKKTFDVLAEGDHGLKNTMRKDKPNLSQVLRDAKVEAEERSKQEEEFVEGRKAHFGAQFDDFQGLVQLEALEMLASQSEGKLNSLLGSLSSESQSAVKRELSAIKELFNLKDTEDDDDADKDHDFDRLITDHIGKLGLHVTPERLIQAHEKHRIWLIECAKKTEDGTPVAAKEVNEAAIQSLAELTARSIEVFHKVAQLLLLEKNAPVSSFKSKAAGLANGTQVLCVEVGILSTKYTQALSSIPQTDEESDAMNTLITNTYLEATNSSTYIQDAFQLLLPVLQHATINAQARCDQD